MRRLQRYEAEVRTGPPVDAKRRWGSASRHTTSPWRDISDQNQRAKSRVRRSLSHLAGRQKSRPIEPAHYQAENRQHDEDRPRAAGPTDLAPRQDRRQPQPGQETDDRHQVQRQPHRTAVRVAAHRRGEEIQCRVGLGHKSRRANTLAQRRHGCRTAKERQRASVVRASEGVGQHVAGVDGHQPAEQLQ